MNLVFPSTFSWSVAVASALVATATIDGAHAATLDPSLQPLAFLVGAWEGGGAVPDTGGRAQGVSMISIEADGHLLLRKDRTDLFDPSGKPSGSFSQVMSIYDEGGAVHADYVDGGAHVIHYGSATIVDGQSVEFTSTGPSFRLRYQVAGPDTLTVWFGVMPPGASAWQTIAEGTIHRAR